jgi:hypothetical protein
MVDRIAVGSAGIAPLGAQDFGRERLIGCERLFGHERDAPSRMAADYAAGGSRRPKKATASAGLAVALTETKVPIEL